MIKTTQIANQTFFHEIDSSKFKFNLVSFHFINQLNEETASLNAALALILKKQCETYPSMIELNKKLKQLYGAKLYSDCSKFGDLQIVSFSIAILADNLALNHEPLIETAFNLLNEIIFKPKLENKIFLKNDVAIEKQNLIELIQCVFNDKQNLAKHEAVKLLFENQNCSCFEFGSIQNTEKINPETLTNAWNNMLKSSEIHIIATGSSDFEKLQSTAKNYISKIDRSNAGAAKNTQFIMPTHFQPKNKQIFDEIAQTKLVMGFATNDKIDEKKLAAIKTMVAAFGGTTTSKLFAIVREKLNYCYRCKADFDLSKKVIWVESGIEAKNLKAAENEIINQLNQIKNGNISPQELDQTKIWLTTINKAIPDSLSCLEGFYLLQILNHTTNTLTDETNAILNVSLNDVIDSAKMFEHCLTLALLPEKTNQTGGLNCGNCRN